MPTSKKEPRVVTVSLEDALERAIKTHAEGNVDYAKYACQSVLQIDPNNVAAKHHLRIIERWRDPEVMIRNVVVEKISDEAKIVFDVGANVGNMTELYRKVFPHATVHAFEPNPEIADALAEKFKDDRQVVVNRMAVGAGEAVMPFHIHRAGANTGIGSFLPLNHDNESVRHLEAETLRTIDVPVTTLDLYCQAHGIETIDFLKLDVQGYEDQCLHGAGGLLARGGIRMTQIEMLLSDMYAKALSFYDIEVILRPHGYRLYAIDDVYPRLGAELFQLDAFYVAP